MNDGPTPRWASLALVIIGAVAVLRGCSCGNDTVGRSPNWSCETRGRRPAPEEEACPGGDRFVKGVCASVRCDAGGGEGNCCPGTICTGGGACEIPASRVVECTSDAACDPGKKCLERPRIKADSKTCGFPPTADDGSCAEGVPFNGRCVEKAPCEAGCDAGRVCNIDLDRCEAPPSDATGCDVTCGAAEMLVFADPDAMLFEQCCAVSCACLPLPDLLPGAWGRFSDLAVTSSEALVSGYDTTFGDLVLGRFDKSTGELAALEYVDGVPAVGSQVAHPDGPRGGIEDPGPDVGQHTSLVVQGGAPRIAYYDVDNADLRWAAASASGAWTTSLIDDGRDGAGANTGDVGRYTSALIDTAGIAHVVYYAHRVERGGELVTTPMYARAKSASPAGYADWDRVAIEPMASCEDACTDAQSCVLEAGGPQCRATRTDCSAACACDAACVDISGGAQCRPSRPRLLLEPCGGHCDAGRTCVADGAGGTTCAIERAGQCSPGCSGEQLCVDNNAGGVVCREAKPYSTVAGLPEGVGLFASLTLDADVPTVVYYDALLGQLRGAVASFDRDDPIGTFAAMPVVCDADDDVGQHARITTGPAGLYVVYQAGDGSTLMLYSGNDLLTGSSVTIDDGTRTGSLHLVGAFAELAFDGSGAPYIAYADQTANDLLLAYQRTGVWTSAIILDEGAFGSFARLAIDGGRAVMSNYQRRNDAGPRDRSRLVLEIRDLSSLP